MSGVGATLAINARWEVTRLRRSQRLWLLLIPPVAGPVGSAIADLYLKIPSQGTALILGLLVTGGLGALIMLDLTALAVGEDLTLRAHLTAFPLPQDRTALLGGRVAVVWGGTLGAYAIGAAGVWVLGGALVTTQPGAVTPLFPPSHLLLALPALLIFLGGVTAAAAVITRAAAQALVAGILAGVLAAGAASYFVFEHQLSAVFPVGLAGIGIVGLGFALYRYPQLEA
ncbi:MAG: hypothetical protein L3K03_00430 [Thermoplasmata archaeon]|nr:hypothetical protein [Thermoplasmata archaeon]